MRNVTRVVDSAHSFGFVVGSISGRPAGVRMQRRHAMQGGPTGNRTQMLGLEDRCFVH